MPTIPPYDSTERDSAISSKQAMEASDRFVTAHDKRRNLV